MMEGEENLFELNFYLEEKIIINNNNDFFQATKLGSKLENSHRSGNSAHSCLGRKVDKLN